MGQRGLSSFETESVSDTLAYGVPQLMRAPVRYLLLLASRLVRSDNRLRNRVAVGRRRVVILEAGIVALAARRE